MRINSKFVTLALVIGSLAGCSSYNTSQPTSALVGHVDSSLKADVSVGDKISGEATANVVMGFIKWGEGDHYVDGVGYGTDSSLSAFTDTTSSVKAAAAYNAVKSSGADLIVAPRYEITEKSYGVFKTIHVTVTGYKGTINSIK